MGVEQRINLWLREPLSPGAELVLVLILLAGSGFCFYLVWTYWVYMREDTAKREATRLIVSPRPEEYLYFHLILRPRQHDADMQGLRRLLSCWSTGPCGKGRLGWWSGLHPADIAAARGRWGDVDYRLLISLTRARRAR